MEKLMSQSPSPQENEGLESFEGRQLAVCDDSAGRSIREEGRRQQADDDDDMAVLERMFGSAKPSHVGTGLLYGAGDVVKGVGLGVMTALSAPVVGARSEGWAGFGKGVGAGLAGLVVFPIAGVASGVSQVLQGVGNTGEAIGQMGKDTKFDSKTGKWVEKYKELDVGYIEAKDAYDKYKRIAAEKEDERPSSSRMNRSASSRVVADTAYYEILGVGTDASQNDIRKAYYKLARESHPDKHPDDPSAKERFQAIGEAYQVLGDDGRRAQYDKHGKEAAEHMDFMDSSILFGMLFGSDAMQDYIGTLQMAFLMESEDLFGNDEGAKVEQDMREWDLARKLRDRVAPYVDARKDKNPSQISRWKLQMSTIAKTLCTKSFGAPLVDAIGFAYYNYAQQYLGSKDFVPWGAWQAKLNNQGRQLSNVVEMISAAQKAQRGASKVKAMEKKKEKKVGQPDEEGADSPAPDATMTEEEIKAAEVSLTHVLTIMLKLCLSDVNSTVRSAAKKYVNDRSVEKSERDARADGLKTLGSIFQMEARKYKEQAAPQDVREQFQDAYIAAAQKADEQRTQK